MANGEDLAEMARDKPMLSSGTSSLFSHIEQGLAKNPHKAAVHCMHQPVNHLSDLAPLDSDLESDGSWGQQNGKHKPGCLTLTYTQVHRAALALAGGMKANGVHHGSTMLIMIPNGGEYAILLWACVIMRLTFTALDPSALESHDKDELRNHMETVNPKIVIVPNTTGAKALNEEVENLGIIQRALCISLENDGSSTDGWTSLRKLTAEGSSNPLDKRSLLEDARNDGPDRIHSVLFTSGTSASRPKGCPQRVGSMSHILHSQAWLINSGNCARVLQQAHNSRAIALQIMLQTWREGGAVVMASSKSFAIEHTLDAILWQEVTFIVLSPSMVHGLADILSQSSGACNGTVGSVQTVHVGGEAVTRGVLIKTTALFPNAKICINQGMTEGGGFFEWPFFHETQLSQIPHFGEICPIGRVAPGASVKICEPGSRVILKKGAPGELHVSCDSIIRGYLGKAGEDSFYADGKGHWFITGDIAMMDEQNLVYLLGRSKEVIKRGSVRVIPAVLESYIEKYTGAQVS